MPGMIILSPSREFLIGRHERGGDIMSEKMRVGINVEQLNSVVMPDDTTAACLWKGFRRDNLPVVVGIIVAVSCDLLA